MVFLPAFLQWVVGRGDELGRLVLVMLFNSCEVLSSLLIGNIIKPTYSVVGLISFINFKFIFLLYFII